MTTSGGRGIVRVCAACGARNRIPAEHLADVGRCGKCKAALSAIAEPLDADEGLFDQVAQSARVPVLVDFWAAWCGPCRVAAPHVKKLAEEMAGKAIVLKVDTDKHPGLSARYRVQGIPNFVVLKQGKVVSQQAGVVPAAQMRKWLEAAAAMAA